ncbi:MAG TPA: hypothetical protein VMJ66_08585 [Geobacteraceae bacterium]|nr:hypothetical protein [Geobacteraceae bacterium]
MKKIILILLPLIIMLAVYLACDPFEVLYSYKTHYNDPRISYNWDYNQTDNLMRNYDKFRYDSFIFGSSRSKAFLTRDWTEHIDSRKVFHYAALAETLYGVEKKIKFIDRRNIHMENCLLIFDTSLLAVTWNSTGHMFVKHPAISGESWTDFHLTFFRAFIDPTFFLTYLDHKIFGRVHALADNRLVISAMRYDPVTGDMELPDHERVIRENATKFYANPAIFYPRDFNVKKYSPPVIGQTQQCLLREIKQILTAHKTHYKVVISPNYDLNYLDRGDLEKLQEIFGRENVYDFSGINEYTRDVHNYYESSHFRPVVARRILDEIYTR